MSLRYADKTAGRPDWKVQLLKTFLQNKGYSKETKKEVQAMCLKMGWVLQTKKVDDGERFRTEIVDGNGAVIHAFSVEDGQIQL